MRRASQACMSACVPVPGRRYIKPMLGPHPSCVSCTSAGFACTSSTFTTAPDERPQGTDAPRTGAALPLRSEGRTKVSKRMQASASSSTCTTPSCSSSSSSSSISYHAPSAGSHWLDPGCQRLDLIIVTKCRPNAATLGSPVSSAALTSGPGSWTQTWAYPQGWQRIRKPHDVQVHKQNVPLELQSVADALQLAPAQLQQAAGVSEAQTTGFAYKKGRSV